MSIAPSKGGGGDFLKGLPDTGYRPWEQREGRPEPLEAKNVTSSPGPGDSGSAALLTVLRSLVEAPGPVAIEQFEKQCTAAGMRASDFYGALSTLLESALAERGDRGVAATDAGRKIAAFRAS